MPESVGYPKESLTEKDIDLLRHARQALEHGKTYRQTTREAKWRRSEKQYLGDHWSETQIEDHTADLTVVNASFSTVNTIVPYVTSESPRFLVEPQSEDASIRNARAQQAFLNKLWNQASTGADKSLEDSAVDMLIYGDGYGKVTWDIVERHFDKDTEVPVEVVEIEVQRISPWDIWIDPMSNGLHDARWVCQQIVTTKREVEADDRFDIADVSELVSTNIYEDGENAKRENGDEEYVVLYEFYDIPTRTMLTFGDNGDKPLRVIEGVYPPIAQAGDYRIPNCPYHMGELEQLWPLQQELNKSRSQLITHRRRNVAKYLIQEHALSEDAQRALESPVVGEFIPILGDQPLDNVVKAINTAPLSAEAYQSADQAMRDMYEISGVNEYLRGASPTVRKTATEASIIEGASNVKTKAKLAIVEKFARTLGRTVLDVARDTFPLTDADEIGYFLTGPEAQQVARIDAADQADAMAADNADPMAVASMLRSGDDVTGITVNPSKDDIFVGLYEVQVETGSTELRNPLFKEQKFREMATTLTQMAPALQQMGVPLNLRKVFEMWFDAAGITDVEGMFEQAAAPPMPPQLGQMAGAGAPPGGRQPFQDQPQLGSVGPPSAPVDESNSGTLPPELAVA